MSIGPEVFGEYRRKGFAKEAMICACEMAKEKGFKIVSQQIRTNNAASIALHLSLGFETNELVFTIGDENLNQNYSDYSIINANYNIGNGVVASVSVLGPERMDYAKIASALKYISDEIKKYSFGNYITKSGGAYGMPACCGPWRLYSERDPGGAGYRKICDFK